LTEHGFLLTRSLATTLPVGAGTSPSLGVIVGPVGRESGAPAMVARVSVFSNTALTSGGGVPTASTTSTGVAMPPTARTVAKKDTRKTFACILNERGVEERNRLREWMLKPLLDSQKS